MISFNNNYNVVGTQAKTMFAYQLFVVLKITECTLLPLGFKRLTTDYLIILLNSSLIDRSIILFRQKKSFKLKLLLY